MVLSLVDAVGCGAASMVRVSGRPVPRPKVARVSGPRSRNGQDRRTCRAPVSGAQAGHRGEHHGRDDTARASPATSEAPSVGGTGRRGAGRRRGSADGQDRRGRGRLEAEPDRAALGLCRCARQGLPWSSRSRCGTSTRWRRPSVSVRRRGGSRPTREEATRAFLGEVVDEVAATSRTSSSSSSVLSGHAAEELIRLSAVAEEVVLGATGSGGFAGMTLGSTSRAVARARAQHGRPRPLTFSADAAPLTCQLPSADRRASPRAANASSHPSMGHQPQRSANRLALATTSCTCCTGGDVVGWCWWWARAPPTHRRRPPAAPRRCPKSVSSPP